MSELHDCIWVICTDLVYDFEVLAVFGPHFFLNQDDLFRIPQLIRFVECGHTFINN